MEETLNHCSSECYHLKALEDLLNDKEAKLEELRLQLTDVQEKCEKYKGQCEQLHLELKAQKLDLRDHMRLTRDAQNQTNSTKDNCSCKSSAPVTEAHTQTFETDFNFVDSAGSALDWQPAEGSALTIADMVKEAAITAQKSDYVYDEKSKMFYSQSTGYYYDAINKLFYEPYSKIYYSFDEETQSYKFHSQLNEDGTTTTIKEEGKSSKKHKKSSRSKDEDSKEGRKKSKKHRKKRYDSSADDENRFSESPPRRSRKKKNRRRSSSSRDSLEDGELNSSSESIVYVDLKRNRKKRVEVVDLDENSCDADSLPPSMRLIVKSSETLEEGSLLLVTYNGGTVGRSETYEVCIPDSSISRLHARIDYDTLSKNYKVTDLGSQNGTTINQVRLSDPKNTSDPTSLKHLDTVSFGNCVFAVHIHSGNNTCVDCEPGLVRAAVQASKAALALQNDEPIIIMTKDEKEKARKEQMKLMKKKYGLQAVDYEPVGDIEIVGYTDRAKHRRKTKGSDNPYEKDGEGTSVDKPLTDDNKGFKMLSSMGWSKGQSLGQSQPGILEPVALDVQFDRAGLGARTNYID